MRKSKVVLHTLRSLDHGGIEVWLSQILPFLDPCRYTFEFLIEAQARCDLDERIARHAHIHRIQNDDVEVWLSDIGRFFEEHANTITIVHSHYHVGSGLILAVAASKGIRHRIAHSHTLSKCGNSRLSAWPELAFSARRLLKESATAYLSPSTSALSDLVEPSEQNNVPCEILPYGLDPARFSFSAQDRRTTREELGISRATFLVGHVGRFVDFKNHRFLVSAFAYCHALRNNCRLLLIGDGPVRGEIEQYAQSIGLDDAVLFLGSRDDVPRLLSAMDLFVFPSTQEGLGLAVVEAQAAGLKVLVSDGIPCEAAVAPERLTRLLLRDGPERWGATMAQYEVRKSNSNIAERCVPLDQNIGAVAQRLMAFYDKISGDGISGPTRLGIV